MKKYNEAVEYYRESLSLRIEMLGEDHPQTANAFIGLGNALIETNEFKEAEEKINKGIEAYKEKTSGRSLEYFLCSKHSG
jgi:tetratricopeptide (TPR) repeat protein